jgi:DNA primase
MNFAEQLKNQLNIVDVVGQYVRLKRKGAGPSYVGLCPFHSEKTPSFNVHSTLQIYKCFGCDAGGDLFKFVMEHDHLTFPEALRTLAERFGIPIPERQSIDDPKAQRRAALLEMHEIAADLFQNNLRGAMGKEARAYLESRGVKEQSISEFRLGLSDSSGQQLVQRLIKFGPALLEESGLVLKRQTGTGFYDRFRGRLMFPIHNESGKVIGFGGRALRSGEEPKYLNSPETEIYKKSTVLYNLHRAKIDARKHGRMMLVEGYMDAIGIYSAGIHEVVATSGTSLSADQIRTIRRHIADPAKKAEIFVTLDPDEAGNRSTAKYGSSLLAEGFRVKVFELPEGLDADEYVQKDNIGVQLEKIDKAISFHNWLTTYAQKQFDQATMEGRVDSFKFVEERLRSIRDGLEKRAALNEAAQRLGLDLPMIRDYLGPNTTEQVRNRISLTAAIPPNEKLLAACVLSSHNARVAIKAYLRQSNMLHLLELKTIFEAVLDTDETENGFSIEAVAERLDGRMQKILAELTFCELGVRDNDAPQQALHCLEALEATALQKARDDLRRQIREMERAGNLVEALRLADELNRTKRASPRP